MTFNADTQSAIIITCLYQICLLKVSLVGSFKHLPDSRHTQITAYFCMQLASKYSSLISCIIHGSFQPTSLSFRVLKMCKIQRENILKRPILCSCSRFIYYCYKKFTEVDLSVFVNRLFHEDLSSLLRTCKSLCIKLSIEHSITCDSRIKLDYILLLCYSWQYVIVAGANIRPTHLLQVYNIVPS